MASTRFTVLTGHLSQYSLADLIGILRHQRKTGRLLIEYAGSPAVLFFKDGNLVDAQYNSLVGVQAILVAFVQPAASFNFNPLIQPTRYSIDVEQQRVILELLGCWTEDTVVVKSTRLHQEVLEHDGLPIEIGNIEPHLLIASPPVLNHTDLPEAVEVLALPAGPSEKSTPSRRHRPWVLAVATFGLLLIFGVPTLIAINSKARKSPVTTNSLQNSIGAVETPSSQASAVDASIVHPKVETAIASGALERKRDSTNQGTTASEKAAAEPRQDNAQNAALVPKPTKETSPSVAKSGGNATVGDTTQTSKAGQTVKVVMRIENGRVVQATIGDRRAGSEAYESLALRIARQRRYPAGVNKQETLVMKVDGPK